MNVKKNPFSLRDSMTAKSQIVAFVERIMYPIVKTLIDIGITAPEFSRIVKRVYAKVMAGKLERDIAAEKAKAEAIAAKMRDEGKSEEEIEHNVSTILQTRRVTASRISLPTGIPRKEIPHLLAESTEDIGEDEWYRNRCDKVLSTWHKSAEYTNSRGKPRALVESKEEAERRGEDASFESLVEEAGQDLSPHALLDELIATNSIERTARGRLKPIKRRYERLGLDADALQQKADTIYDHIEAINAKLRGQDPSIDEGAVFSIDIDAEQVPVLLNRIRGLHNQNLQSAENYLLQAARKSKGRSGKKVKITFGSYINRGDEMRESKYFSTVRSEDRKAANN